MLFTAIIAARLWKTSSSAGAPVADGVAHLAAGRPGPSPGEVEPSLALHPALDSFVARLLSTDPSDRPSSAAKVCEELARIEQTLSPSVASGRSALLDALCGKPSRDAWLALCRYLEGEENRVRQTAERKLDSWPAELRRGILGWWESVKREQVHPLWSLVRTMDLSGRGLTDDDARLIANCPALSPIRRLNLANNAIGPDGLAALASSPHLGGLEWLSLTGNPVGRRGLQAVGNKHSWQRLKGLELGHTGLQAEDLKWLVDSELPLEHLDLAGNNLGLEGAEILSKATFTPLRSLVLAENSLGPDGVAVLSVSPCFSNLRLLDLRHNGLGPGGSAAIAVAKNFSQLRKQFSGRFYEKLFDRFPSVKPLFSGVSLPRQQQHLFSAIVMMIENLRSPESLTASLEQLSRRHIGYGVSPSHYEAFQIIFLEALQEMSGEEWSAELEEDWREALQAIGQVMVRAHREGRSGPASGSTRPR